MQNKNIIYIGNEVAMLWIYYKCTTYNYVNSKLNIKRHSRPLNERSNHFPRFTGWNIFYHQMLALYVAKSKQKNLEGQKTQFTLNSRNTKYNLESANPNFIQLLENWVIFAANKFWSCLQNFAVDRLWKFERSKTLQIQTKHSNLAGNFFLEKNETSSNVVFLAERPLHFWCYVFWGNYSLPALALQRDYFWWREI